jgi:hypothetical protein
LNIWLVILVVLVGLLLLLEVGLRLLVGLGNPLLYRADEEIGYLLAPNQCVRRFGNRITINEYSMRSPTITRTRPASVLRVLLLGDSIANGASWTDQAQTISARITTQLELVIREASTQNRTLQNTFERVEVLNASANSWGPRHELAYLKRFGTFEAQVVVLLLNTDDLFAAAPTSEPVGRDRNYPDRKPTCALAEAFNRYLLPKLHQLRSADRGMVRITTQEAPPVEPVALAQQEGALFEGNPLDFNLDAICQMQRLVAGAGAQFVLAITPRLREIGESGSHDYELKARDRLTQLIQNQQISYLDFLPIFNHCETPQRLYRDPIHLSAQGNQLVSEAIARSLQQLLQLPTTAANG